MYNVCSQQVLKTRRLYSYLLPTCPTSHQRSLPPKNDFFHSISLLKHSILDGGKLEATGSSNAIILHKGAAKQLPPFFVGFLHNAPINAMIRVKILQTTPIIYVTTNLTRIRATIHKSNTYYIEEKNTHNIF